MSSSPFPPPSLDTAAYLASIRRSFLDVRCGRWTYGIPEIVVADDDAPRRLWIGRYCSIAKGVTIFVGRQGIHPTDTLSTYPLSMPVSADAVAPLPPGFEPPSAFDDANLDVVIGDDVWLGRNAMIFAGVTIGHGAVVGAQSLVTRDVPPFTIVAGSPAKPVRLRHDGDTAQRILASRWWELDPDELWRRAGPALLSRNVEQVIGLLDGAPVAVAPPPSARPGAALALRYWPAEEHQLNYTGSAGAHLLARTERFVDFLEAEGVFPIPDGALLDYGCGWGRIASLVYARHGTQAVLADAWEASVRLVIESGLPADVRHVPERLPDNGFAPGSFACIYSFSVFTHLNRDAFEQNLAVLLASLREDGRLYLTVRHEDFIDIYNQKNPGARVSSLGDDDFLHYTQHGPYYGETMVGRNVLRRLHPQARYCGHIDKYQHLYCIPRSAGVAAPAPRWRARLVPEVPT